MNDLVITIGLISFPGLIATLLADKLVVHTARWGTFKYSVYTFVFGLMSYVLLQILNYLVGYFGYSLIYLNPAHKILQIWSVLTAHKTAVSLPEVAWATSLSPIIAVIAIATVNLKLLNKLATHLKITTKFGDENLFSYFLNLSGVNWVYVRDRENNLSYRGQISSFSENDKLQELVLSDVTVYTNLESDELYKVPMIYLSKPLGSFLIIEAAPDTTTGDKDEERDQRRLNQNPSKGRRKTNNKHKDTASASASKEKIVLTSNYAIKGTAE